jgi:hypothetical protein
MFFTPISSPFHRGKTIPKLIFLLLFLWTHPSNGNTTNNSSNNNGANKKEPGSGDRKFDRTNLTIGGFERMVQAQNEALAERAKSFPGFGKFDTTNLTVGSYEEEAAEVAYEDPKMYYYDEYGYL